MILLRSKTVSWILVGLGFIVSAYLLWRHLILIGSTHISGVDLCSVLFNNSCDGVLRNPSSVFLGLPIAGWGLVYYGTLITFLLLASFLGKAFESEANLALLILSISALIINLILTGVMFFGIAPFCPICAIVHLINLALVFFFKRLTGRPIPHLIQDLKGWGKYLLWGKVPDLDRARWKLLGFFSTVLAALVIFQWVFIQKQIQEGFTHYGQDSGQLLATFEANEKQNIPVGAEDPIMGPADASIQIVVFSDFQCPGCKSYAKEMFSLMEQYRPNLQLVFKNFPLDRACNSLMEDEDLHTRACEAAYAAEAANKQGKFWLFHDQLFAANLNQDKGIFESIAQAVGLDLQRFNVDRSRNIAGSKIQSDIELAERIKVDATPALFLNRRRIPDTRPESIRFLIDHVLEHADQ